ncbi:MAG: hypothetical protein Q4E68_08920 [Prevotellaceae bacterium]|nr:hypothetical protein [Prevotellaceae bacterium]
MNKYDEIINSLQGKQPNVANEEEFTDMIMDSLPDFDTMNNEELTEKTPSNIIPMARKNSSIIIALRTIASIAAMYLVGLFIWFNADTDTPEEAKTYMLSERIETTNYKLSVDENSTPAELYMCYIESRKTKENSISKLRKLINEQYENN